MNICEIKGNGSDPAIKYVLILIIIKILGSFYNYSLFLSEQLFIRRVILIRQPAYHAKDTRNLSKKLTCNRLIKNADMLS